MSSCDATCFPDASGDVECHCPLKRDVPKSPSGQTRARVLSAGTLLLEAVLFSVSHHRSPRTLRAAFAAARSSNVGRKAMSKVNRRSALGIGLAAVSAAMVKPAAAQATSYKDTTPWPGVVVREYEGETPSLIPGFKTVSMRDIIMQPGSKTMGPPMMNAMVCHVTEGELRLEQEGKTFTGKKNFVWTCNKETKEQAYNDGSVVAIMRITDLKA
ncbi:hypothetical protein DXU04_14300 [Bradyrhizobium diazoefficiens]